MGVGEVVEPSGSPTSGSRTLFTGPLAEPDRYVVEEQDLDLAERGGEGVVYRAREVRSGRPVALKLLTTLQPEEVHQLARRSRSLQDLDHPNLMQQVEVFYGCALYRDGREVPCAGDFDVPFSVANWVEGTSLVDAARLATTRMKLDWVADVADALVALHGVRTPEAPHGIVHRDVKPSNVRVRPDGTAVLLDFGVARPVLDGEMTAGVGTHLWRAPEVLAGRGAGSSTLSDAWSVGALAHWLLVGEPPYLDGRAAARRRLTDAISDVGGRPAVARHLSRMLASSPADRPHDLADWADSLRRLAARRRSRVRTAALSMVALLVLSAVTMRPTVRAEPPPSSTAPVTASSIPGQQDWGCFQFKYMLQGFREALRARLTWFDDQRVPSWALFGSHDGGAVLIPNLEDIRHSAEGAFPTLRPIIEWLGLGLGTADPRLFEAIVVQFFASADVRPPSDATRAVARLIAASVVGGPSGAAELAARLQSLDQIFATASAAGCIDGPTYVSPRALTAADGARLRDPVTDLTTFYARVDELRGRLFWPPR